MFIEDRIWTLFKRNWQHTLTYWSVFFSFGLCIAFLGPTILDLKCQTQSTLQEITWVFFSQQFCLLLGSSVAGVFKKTLFSALSALLLSSLIISIIFAIIPFCYNVLQLAIAMAVAGLAMGIIDTIANIQLVSLYQKDSSVFLQALHFFIGFGALVSPLIADPFLSEHCGGNGTEDPSEIIHHFRSAPLGSMLTNITQGHHSVAVEEQSIVSYAFWIMAVINLPVPVAVFVLMYQEKLVPCCPGEGPRLLDRDELAMETQGAEEQEPEKNDPEVGGHGDLSSCCQMSGLRAFPPTFFGIHILGGLVLFMTDGIVGAYAGFVYTYAVSLPMSLPHKTAGILASVFWAAITAGRLVSIPLACRFRTMWLLLLSMAGVIVTVLLLLIFYTSSAFLFVGTCLLGLFLSSIFPCMLAYTEDILDYQGCATTVLVTSAGMGEMVMQVLVGSIIHTAGSYSFLLCGMTIGGIGFILFFGLLLCHSLHLKLTGTTRKTAMVKETTVENKEENGEIAVTPEIQEEKHSNQLTERGSTA
ncbi:major facilitator superfamily domain-containing protein 4B [Denticeps clupeoides]|uniref:Major facilitator superfamily domain-containing protein 4 n=1 Tax=Denticeps clupeoides TaxID=299321 RepID=A0AAY4E4G9_9TELE|nr:major facilitator superfamily domain-containing protein 4A [Denticeps clupeoides]